MFAGERSRTELERRAAGLLAMAILALLFTAAAATGVVGRHLAPARDEAAIGATRFGSALVLLQTGLPSLTTATTRPPARSAPTKVGAARVTPARTAARPRPPAGSAASGCGPALAWLSAHAAPGFRFVCPGYAMGHQAMTCRNIAGVCPGEAVIIIADPCPAAYENEAWNSLLSVGLASGPVDPFGACPE